jgi:hypothetical protein
MKSEVKKKMMCESARSRVPKSLRVKIASKKCKLNPENCDANARLVKFPLVRGHARGMKIVPSTAN